MDVCWHQHGDGRQLTQGHIRRVSVWSLRRPATLTARNRRRDSTCVLPFPFLAMRCLSESTPLCASRARESPIVARVVRAIGRG